MVKIISIPVGASLPVGFLATEGADNQPVSITGLTGELSYESYVKIGEVTTLATPNEPGLTPTAMRSSVVDPNSGVEMFFSDASGNAKQFEVGQYVMGDWFIVDDGTLHTPKVTPEFVAESGYLRYFSTGKFIDASKPRKRNGAMINPLIHPGNSYIPSGIQSHYQGFDNFSHYGSEGQRIQYENGAENGNSVAEGTWNKDPAVLGQPIRLTSGISFVKSRSDNLTPENFNDYISSTGRAANAIYSMIQSHAIFHIVSEVPIEGSFAPGPAGSNRAPTTGFHIGMIDKTALRSLDQSATPGYRTFRSMAEENRWRKNSWCRADDKARSMFGWKVESTYTRNTTLRQSKYLMALHRPATTGDDSEEWKDRLIYSLIQDAIDTVGAISNGDDYWGGGGFESGWKALVATAGALLGSPQVFRDVCAVGRVNPNGDPIYANNSDPATRRVSYGFAEDKRFVQIMPEDIQIPSASLQEGSTDYRVFKTPYQQVMQGWPEWFERANLNAGKWVKFPQWLMAYRENNMSTQVGVLACELTRGGGELYGLPYVIDYMDRSQRARNAGRQRSESGQDAATRYLWDSFRSLLDRPVWTARPDVQLSPAIGSFSGEGTRLIINIPARVLDNGSPILSWNVRYRVVTRLDEATYPPFNDPTNTGWTVINGINFDSEGKYQLVGLSPSTSYAVQLQAVNAQGAGPWTVNIREFSLTRRSAAGDKITQNGSTKLRPYEIDVFTGLGPQSVGTTDTNQPVTVDRLPTMLGGNTVGSTKVVDHGSYIYEPWQFTYQWRINGTDVAGATGRSFDTTGRPVGAVVSVRFRASNSSSTYELVLTSPALTASVSPNKALIGTMTRLDQTASIANQTVAFPGAHDGRTTPTLFVHALVPSASGGTSFTSPVVELRTSSARVNSGQSSTAIASTTALSATGNNRVFTQAHKLIPESAGADRTSFTWTYTRAGTCYAAATYGLDTFDIDKAYKATFVDTNMTVDEEDISQGEPYVATATIRDERGREVYFPKGSLIIASVAAGAKSSAVTEASAPIWDGVVAIPGATTFGYFSPFNASNAPTDPAKGIASIGDGILSQSGIVTVSVGLMANPVQVALTVLVIPPK